MIIGRGRSAQGRRVVLLGLSHENVARLVGGKPIHATPEMHGLPADLELVLVVGETEATLAAELERLGVRMDRR